VIIGIHVMLVQMHGMSVPPSLEGKNLKKMKFFPSFFLRDLIGWVLAIGALAALAALFPWELGEKADAFAPAPAGIRPEWYFLFMFQTLKLIPAKVLSFDGEVLGILAFAVGGLIWFTLPFLDDPAKPRRKILFTLIGIVVVLYIVVLTIVGFIG
jgi:quinol-cytochrome oxidoreductase complex cytochrome b subunit